MPMRSPWRGPWRGAGRCHERVVMSQTTSRYRAQPPVERLPQWLRSPVGDASALEAVQAVVKQQRLHTICEEGRCPNRAECYAAGTATFLLAGPVCTRSCAFCQVEKGQAPAPLDPLEPSRVAQAVRRLGLRYVVLTAVARDDQADHGASVFVATIEAIRAVDAAIAIEVLTPDFWGGQRDEASAIAAQRQRLGTVLAAEPHPNADKLKLCSVDAGGETPLRIVCGAPNVAAGMTVPLATLGTIMPNGLEIKRALQLEVHALSMGRERRHADRGGRHAVGPRRARPADPGRAPPARGGAQLRVECRHARLVLRQERHDPDGRPRGAALGLGLALRQLHRGPEPRRRGPGGGDQFRHSPF